MYSMSPSLSSIVPALRIGGDNMTRIHKEITTVTILYVANCCSQIFSMNVLENCLLFPRNWLISFCIDQGSFLFLSHACYPHPVCNGGVVSCSQCYVVKWHRDNVCCNLNDVVGCIRTRNIWLLWTALSRFYFGDLSILSFLSQLLLKKYFGADKF